jgi:hypothetical protein
MLPVFAIRVKICIEYDFRAALWLDMELYSWNIGVE